MSKIENRKLRFEIVQPIFIALRRPTSISDDLKMVGNISDQINRTYSIAILGFIKVYN